MLKSKYSQISFVLSRDEKDKFMEICRNGGESATEILREYVRFIIKRNENLLDDFKEMRKKISYS